MKKTTLTESSLNLFITNFFPRTLTLISLPIFLRLIALGSTFEINVDGLEFQWIETPGHASHHFSFMMMDKKIMFSGDSAGMFIPGLNDALVPTTPHPYRMSSGIESLNAMIEYKLIILACFVIGFIAVIKDDQ